MLTQLQPDLQIHLHLQRHFLCKQELPLLLHWTTKKLDNSSCLGVQRRVWLISLIGSRSKWEQFWETLKKMNARTNWNEIIMIPDADVVIRNLITNFGQFTWANISAHAIPYIDT
jgi:hypothetical protein